MSERGIKLVWTSDVPERKTKCAVPWNSVEKLSKLVSYYIIEWLCDKVCEYNMRKKGKEGAIKWINE